MGYLRLDITFADSHTLWVQHFSGAFSQLDLRASSRPLDAMPRAAIAWDPCGSLMFVSGKSKKWEIPYDDMYVRTSIPSSCA